MSEQVTKRESSEMEERREPASIMRPPVDVFENDAGISLYADLPGVSKERLTVRVDGDTLLIEGEARLDTPADMEVVYAELATPHYRRSFSLSSELDGKNIHASLKDGVLSLRIPKQAAAQPRKIEVQTG